jgi:putative aldouronate transport system permease protein
MGVQNARYSYATAVGLLKAIIAFILLYTANRITKKLDGTSLF